MRVSPAVRRAICVGSSVATVLAACAGGDGARGGTVVISSGGDADVLLPPITALAQSREVIDLVFERLAAIGPDLNTLGDAGWTPRLAERWTWAADSSSVTFHLDRRARWHDSVPVRANDVRFAFALYTDPRVGASDGRDIADAVDSVTVIDSLTVTAWFKGQSPERFYTLVSNLVPLPEHLLASVSRDSLAQSAFARAPVGSGPFRFGSWVAKQRIEITAVGDHFRGRPRIDRVIWTIAPEGLTAAQRVFSGEADFIETLTPAEVARLPQYPDLHAVRLRGNALGYLVFNTRDPENTAPHALLGSREIRRALAMALDRAAIAQNVVDTSGRVPLGPFSRVQWSADSTLRQLPFDPANAGRVLDSLGWRLGSDSLRHRGNTTLAFSILVPTSNSFRQHLAVVLQEQWRKVGARVTIDLLDFTAFITRMRGRQFDVTLMQVNASPSPSGVRQAWTTQAITMKTGYNIGRYSNPVVDSAIDHAVVAPTRELARAHYRVAYQTLLDDAPGIWLYEPAVIAAANKRLDVSTIRPDAWWTSLPSWRVAAGSRPRSDSTRDH